MGGESEWIKVPDSRPAPARLSRRGRHPRPSPTTWPPPVASSRRPLIAMLPSELERCDPSPWAQGAERGVP